MPVNDYPPLIRNHKKFSELERIEGLKKLLRTHVCYIYGVSDKMSRNEIREEPGSQEKEVIFRKKEKEPPLNYTGV